MRVNLFVPCDKNSFSVLVKRDTIALNEDLCFEGNRLQVSALSGEWFGEKSYTPPPQWNRNGMFHISLPFETSC